MADRIVIDTTWHKHPMTLGRLRALLRLRRNLRRAGLQASLRHLNQVADERCLSALRGGES